MSKASQIARFATNQGYNAVQTNGANVTARNTINIVNAVITDDSVNARTNVTIGGIQDLLDGGVVDGVAQYDGGDPTTTTFTYNINGGTP
jgi:hypothetical protein